MKMDVRLFARARDAAGAERISVDLPSEARVADLRTALADSIRTWPLGLESVGRHWHRLRR